MLVGDVNAIAMKDIVKGFREIVQDLLVPELRAIKVELEYHRKEFEKISKQFELIDKRFEQVDKRFEQIDKRFEVVFEELRQHRTLLDRHTAILEQHTQILNQHSKAIEELLSSMKRLELGQAEIISKLDIDRRLARIETVLEKAGILSSSGTATVSTVKEEEQKYGKK